MIFRRKTKTRLLDDPPVLILRDYLAVDRTRLANERALLAHLSTGTTVLAAGVSGFNLFQNSAIKSVAMMFIFVGVSIICAGLVNYRRMHKRLEALNIPEYTEVVEEMVKKLKRP